MKLNPEELQISSFETMQEPAELATSLPAARLVLFGDAGWVGNRDAWDFDPPLLSAGIGASFLDGLLRFDVARALREPKGWRVDLYLDAAL